MASFVVMQPPGERGADAVQFVRDGFSIVALAVPFVWLAWHRLWIEAALVFAAALLIAALGELYPWALALSPLVTVLGIGVALEGGTLRAAALKRRGWSEAGIVDAAGMAEAEIRWFGDDAGAAQTQTQTQTPPPPASPSPPPFALPALQPRPETGPAIGLLAYPGSR